MEFGFRTLRGADCEDVEAEGGILKAVSSDVGFGGPDDASAFAQADGVFGRVGGLAGFDFDEDEDIVLPSDDVHFAAFGPVTGSDDAESNGAKVVEAEDFRAAAERQEAVQEKRKGH